MRFLILFFTIYLSSWQFSSAQEYPSNGLLYSSITLEDVGIKKLSLIRYSCEIQNENSLLCETDVTELSKNINRINKETLIRDTKIIFPIILKELNNENNHLCEITKALLLISNGEETQESIFSDNKFNFSKQEFLEYEKIDKNTPKPVLDSYLNFCVKKTEESFLEYYERKNELLNNGCFLTAFQNKKEFLRSKNKEEWIYEILSKGDHKEIIKFRKNGNNWIMTSEHEANCPAQETKTMENYSTHQHSPIIYNVAQSDTLDLDCEFIRFEPIELQNQ